MTKIKASWRQGYSFYMCWGKSAGFKYEFTRNIKRLCLWKLSLAIINYDIEPLVYEGIKSYTDAVRVEKNILTVQEANDIRYERMLEDL